MYESILHLPYSKAKVKFLSAIDVNSVRKVITFKNDTTIDSYSDFSDVVVYYDVISDSIPLLLVERIMKKKVKIYKLRKAVKKLNKKLIDFNASICISDNRKFVDIVVVKINIYNGLMEG